MQFRVELSIGSLNAKLASLGELIIVLKDGKPIYKLFG